MAFIERRVIEKESERAGAPRSCGTPAKPGKPD